MADAILFNGAAALIAQEAGILDLLLGNVSGVSGVLDVSKVKFVGGLSSGALMTFAFNAAFSQNSKLPWDEFKNEVLFTLTTEKVYKKIGLAYDTTPLRDLLEKLTKDADLHLIKDLPFESAILATFKYPAWLPKATQTKIFWLTNIEKVANVLARETQTSVVTQNIKEHQFDITLVSALMSSTAIPLVFPYRRLFYNDSSNNSFPIKRKYGFDGYFVDGGFGDDFVFGGFQDFFGAYKEKFDNIYFISPNYTNMAEKVLNQISSTESSEILEEKATEEEFFRIMDNYTKAFITEIRKYNSDAHLAEKIYYCKLPVEDFELLDFSREQEQYTATIDWGMKYPDKIAIDITTIPDSELEIKLPQS